MSHGPMKTKPQIASRPDGVVNQRGRPSRGDGTTRALVRLGVISVSRLHPVEVGPLEPERLEGADGGGA